MSVIRWLFRHPLEWFVSTLLAGAVLGVTFPPVLHNLFMPLLASALTAGVGTYIHWEDRRADNRARWINDMAEDRSHWELRRYLELSPTQQIPTLRVVGENDPASHSLAAAARKGGRHGSVTNINPDRWLGFLSGQMDSLLAPHEPGDDDPEYHQDDEPSEDIPMEAT